MQFSSYQLAIFDHIEHGTGNGIADAVAGSGKSTTIKEAFRRCQRGRGGNSAVFLAFNSAIVKELKADGVPAKTLNGLGWGALLRAPGPVPELDQDKNANILRALLSPHEMKMYFANALKLVGLAKGIGLVPKSSRLVSMYLNPLTRDTQEVWYDLIDRYDIQMGDDPMAEEDELIRICREVLVTGLLQPHLADFDDQKYLPVVRDLPIPYPNDWVFLDECQDLNMIDRALVRKALKPGGRLFAVGDPHQAIYGFRGADVNSFELIEQEFNCKRFPLSVCYRCPTSVIELAQRLVPHLEARPGAPEGLVETVDAYDYNDFKANDLVLCRNNAPLVALAYKLVAARKPVVVLGRDFGKQLIAVVTKLCGGIQEDENFTIGLVERLDNYKNREIEKALARHQDSKATRIADMCESLQVVIDNVDPHSAADIQDAMLRLFDDHARREAVTLSSIHKMKGGQAQRVWVLDRFYMPSKYARSDEALQQEYNLEYVCYTRSQAELRFISSDGYGKQKPEAA